MDYTGQTFAGFEIIAKLGEGGMGAVYKARQPLLDRLVALKVMSPQLGGDSGYIARFVREAASAAKLTHPNMVQVHTAGEEHGVYYIVMEFVEGESLAHRIRRCGVMDPAEALAITLHVATALQCAWNEAKLIHRDIKPDNIFLSKKGDVKVGDLGLAKSVGGGATEMTQSGMMMGSPHYMSPEQARASKETDFRAEIYSMGCTLYQLLTGTTPYQADEALAVVLKHVTDPVPDILVMMPDCPPALVALVAKMMAKAASDRHGSYEELIAEVWQVSDVIRQQQSALTAAPAPAVAVTGATLIPTVVPGSKSVIRDVRFVIGGVAAVAAALLAGLVLWSPWKQSTVFDSAISTASAPSSAQWRNLIPGIAPERDGIAGGWKVENGGLLCTTQTNWSFCEIPVDYKGANYDLRFRVTRGEGGRDGVFFFFRKNNTGGVVTFDYFTPKVRMVSKEARVAAIFSIKGQWEPRDDPNTLRSQWLLKGEERTVLIQVRDKGVAVSLDSKEVFHWEGIWEDVTQRGTPHHINRPVFGVSSWQCEVLFSAIEMREVVGDSGFTRQAPPAAALKQPGSVFTNSVGAEMVYGVDVTAASKAGDSPPPSAPKTGAILAPPETRVAALTTTPKVGDVYTLPLGSNVTMELMGIPPGEFMLGSTKEDRAWAVANGRLEEEVKHEGETPRTAVIKRGFWMGRTEVTVGQWKQFVKETAYVTDGEKRGGSYVPKPGAIWAPSKGESWRHPDFGFETRDDHPVTCISWNDAVAFGDWLTKQERKSGRMPADMMMRLPTEAEWEYACRAGGQTTFWWGGSKEDGQGRMNSNSKNDGFELVAPVDSFRERGRNRFGLADMLGNVWEWCLDGYDATQAHETLWTGDPVKRVLRGGSYRDSRAQCRCAHRSGSVPSTWLRNNGFRVVMSVDPTKDPTPVSVPPSSAPRASGILAPAETHVTAPPALLIAHKSR